MDGVWRTPTPVAKLFRLVVELLHHVLRQSLGTLYLTAREVFSLSLSLSLPLSLPLLLSMVHSLSLCLITQNQSLLDTLCTRNQKLAKSGNSQNILLQNKTLLRAVFIPSSTSLFTSLRSGVLHQIKIYTLKTEVFKELLGT